MYFNRRTSVASSSIYSLGKQFVKSNVNKQVSKYKTHLKHKATEFAKATVKKVVNKAITSAKRKFGLLKTSFSSRKRQKLSSKMAYSGRRIIPTRGRMGIRRRIRQIRRKRSFRRAKPNKLNSSIRSEITKIAIESSECKRSLNFSGAVTASTGHVGVTILNPEAVTVWRLSTEKHQFNVGPDANNSDYFSGNKYYQKGISIKGSISNPSAERRVKVFFKVIQFKHAQDAVQSGFNDAGTTGSLNITTQFHNPLTGKNVPWDLLIETHKMKHKLGIGNQFKVLKSWQKVLDPRAGDMTELDTMHFEKYIPLNRIVKNEFRAGYINELPGNAFGYKVWLMVYYCDFDITSTVNSAPPNLQFASISYFRDIN